MQRVFLSHAGQDRDFADDLTDLLLLGTDLHRDLLFYSSDAMGPIPEGSDFVHQIRDALRESRLVVALVSPAYLRSSFCMAELEGALALGVRVFPVLVPPLAHDDLPPSIRNREMPQLDDSGVALDRLARRLREDCEVHALDVWNQERAKFLRRRRAPKATARRVLKGLVGEGRPGVAVYSSHWAEQAYDQAGNLIDIIEGRIAVCAFPDATGAANLYAALARWGRPEPLRAITPNDWKPGNWDSDFITVGSKRANFVSDALLSRYECPFQFSVGDDAIIDRSKSRELRRGDADFGILAKYESEDCVYVVAAGIGSPGTHAACDYLIRQIDGGDVQSCEPSFACVVSIDLRDPEATPQLEVPPRTWEPPRQ